MLHHLIIAGIRKTPGEFGGQAPQFSTQRSLGKFELGKNFRRLYLAVILLVAYGFAVATTSCAMTKVRINITVPGATAAKLKTVKTSLVRQGVEVDSVLEAIGVITGKVAKSRLPSLDAGAGATVELDETIQLPPPDAPIQ